MTRILIVEDDENKRIQLSHFLRDEFPSYKVDEERSLQSGLRHVRRDPPSLILLDMTLPTYDTGPDEPGGLTQIFGGREFLRQMDRFDIVVPVVVVTQFESFGKGKEELGLSELDNNLREEHAHIYRGSVYYHAAIHGWENDLKRMIESIVSAE